MKWINWKEERRTQQACQAMGSVRGRLLGKEPEYREK
jgi:hypothetical protein